MVRDDCPKNTLPPKPWNNGLIIGDYLYLLSTDNNYILKVENKCGEDAVLIGCASDGKYKAYDGELNEVTPKFENLDEIEISIQAYGHQMTSMFNRYIIATSWNWTKYGGPGRNDVQLIDVSGEVMEITKQYYNEPHSYDGFDAVCTNGIDKIYTIATNWLHVFNMDLEIIASYEIDPSGLKDPSSMIYYNDNIYTADWWNYAVNRRNKDELNTSIGLDTESQRHNITEFKDNIYVTGISTVTYPKDIYKFDKDLRIKKYIYRGFTEPPLTVTGENYMFILDHGANQMFRLDEDLDISNVVDVDLIGLASLV